MAEPSAATDDLTRRILASAKYRSLDETLVRRIAAEAAQRFQNRTDAVKYAKRKLHQAFGAFLNGSPVAAVNAFVAAVAADDTTDPRAAALAAMRAHASAAERVDWLTPLYEQIGQWCGTADSVFDMACGLNPLAIPWMLLAPDARYIACEIDVQLVEALGRLDGIFPVRFTATTCDLVATPPVSSAHVALMLKTVTTIEQQRTGAAGRVLAALRCPHVVLSLPRGSLSGSRTYVDDAGRIVADATAEGPYRVIDEATFGNEIAYHLVRQPG